MSRANDKLKAVQAAIALWENNILADATAFAIDKLVNETINGEPGTMPRAPIGARTVVGRDTGMLARSHVAFAQSHDFYVIRSNTSVAPYNLDVAQTVARRQGRDYLRTLKFFYEGEIKRKAAKALRRGVKIANDTLVATYQNPYQ